jgi:hypothetical protein
MRERELPPCETVWPRKYCRKFSLVRVAVLLGVVLISGAAHTAEEKMNADFCVSPAGNDAQAGTVEKPFATLARARDAVRVLKKHGLQKDITVLVRGGTYWLPEPLAFGPEDSGAEACSVTYAAAPGEGPVLSGGRPITGWKKGAGSFWTAEIPEVKAGRWRFRELFVNGRRAVRARAPNDGFFRVVAAGPDNRTSFTFNPGEVRAFANTADAEIVFLHDWSISRVLLQAVDVRTQRVSLADPIGPGAMAFFAIAGFEPHARYYVENAIELLDAPGEWHLDRATGVLSYWPLPGEDLAKAEVVAPFLERLLEIHGTPEQRVQNLRFVGLTFAHCSFPLPEHGYAEIQAGQHEVRPNLKQSWESRRNPAALVVSNAVRCVLAGCEVTRTGTSGISVEGKSDSNRIERCRIQDIGGNGIMIGSTTELPAELARDNVVSNCLVRRCGALSHGCVGIWAGLTEGTAISHNEICDLPYSGVSVGWNWSVKPTPCQKNIVSHNHIHHVMGMLSDGGGIYTLGRQPGTVLRGNLIHDIPANAGSAESNGMFLDEGSSEFIVEGNTILGVARSSIRFHKAKQLTIRNNTLLTSSGQAAFKFNACQEKEMSFETNTVAAVADPDWLKQARATTGPEGTGSSGGIEQSQK